MATGQTSAPAEEQPTTRCRHPGSHHLYEVFGRNRIRITDEKSGDTGWFDARGRWVAGALKAADPHFCVWIDHKSSEASFISPLAGYNNASD